MVSVWVDTNKTTIDNIGAGKMCLKEIVSSKVTYQD